MELETSETGVDSSTSVMEYIMLAWHWAWLILLIGLAAGGAAFFVSSRQTPIYETTTQLLVSDPPAMRSVDSSPIVTSYDSTSTYSELLTDLPVLQKVKEALNLSRSAQSLRSAITVSVVKTTQIISVSVSDPNPQVATDVANTIGKVFGDRIHEIQDQRFSASRENLQKQMNDMELQVAGIQKQYDEAIDPAAKDQIQPRLTQYQGLYNNLVTSFEQVRLAEAQSSTNVIQVEPATLPPAPISPKPLQTALFVFLVGISLAIGGVLLVDFLDDSIKNPDEIKQRFGISALGIISTHAQVEGRPITIDQPRNPVSESFRSLRTNIQFASVDHPARVLVITSPTPQDGKTTVAINLAVVLAQSGKRVALMDADMRRPKIHRRLNLNNRLGLSNMFVRSLDSLGEAVQDTGIDGLEVVSSGGIPPNPAELLGSQRMQQIIQKLEETNDYILIDTPPVLSVTDAVALSTMVDGVLLVAKPGQTKLTALKQAIEQLRRVNANLLGVVLNDVEPHNARYGYYYRQYYYRYSYYSNDPKSGKKTKKKSKEAVESEGG
jgi:succinoglycan biosynthesis transport protein ExoP